MSDEEYTPNIDDVRSRYVFYASELTDDFDEKGFEFDRWLNEQLDAAWKRGEAEGWSRAMRHMSDEPHTGRQTESPYRKADS